MKVMFNHELTFQETVPVVSTSKELFWNNCDEDLPQIDIHLPEYIMYLSKIITFHGGLIFVNSKATRVSNL